MQCIEDHKFLRECCSECCIEAASASTRIRILVSLTSRQDHLYISTRSIVAGGKIILIRLMASPMDSVKIIAVKNHFISSKEKASWQT